MRRNTLTATGSALLLALGMLLLFGPAHGRAASIQATLTIHPGSLTLTTGTPRIASGANGVDTVRVPFRLIDARGTGEGWTVDASAPHTAMRLTGDWRRPLSAYAVGAPTLARPPLSLGAAPHSVIVANPGQSGMGGFVGGVTLTLPKRQASQAGQLTLTLSHGTGP